MNNAPFYYDYINTQNATITPSTIHVQNSLITRFFAKYLLQKAISIFKWEMPKTWDKSYFLYTLFTHGWIAIVKTNKYGVIPQQCTLYGFDIFYRPSHAIITNPLLQGKDSILQPRIGKQTTLLKLQPDYGNIMDLVNFYAGMLALSSETMTTNLINSKLAYIGFADNKADAETLKKMFDMVISGEPAIVLDKKGRKIDEQRNWDAFMQNIGQNFIVKELLECMNTLEKKFLTQIGIGNVNTDKKERMIVAEAESNNEETATMVEMWLEELQEKCEEASEMFGIELSVDWRIKPDAKGVKSGGGEEDE